MSECPVVGRTAREIVMSRRWKCSVEKDAVGTRESLLVERLRVVRTYRRRWRAVAFLAREAGRFLAFAGRFLAVRGFLRVGFTGRSALSAVMADA